MRRVVAIAVGMQMWVGCVALPEEEGEAALLDGAIAGELVLDGGTSRPPVGQPYRGPQCSTTEPMRDGGGGYIDGSDAAVPSGGDGDGDQGHAGGGGEPALPMADAGMMGPTPMPGPEHPGDVVITEIMFDPKGRPDGDGEWIELWNATDAALSLGACALDDGAATRRMLSALVLEPGAFATIGRGAEGGFPPDIIAALSLTNTSDTVAIVCDGVEIDRVTYDGTFPLKAGASLSLEPSAMTAIDNDDSVNWCQGVDDYGGDLGTPGAPNPSCSPPDAGAL